MNLDQLTSRNTGQLIDRLTIRNVKSITPSDAVNLEKEGYVALFDVADDGKIVKVTTLGGGVVSWTLAKNEIIPVLVKKVWASTTTAATVYICN